MLHIKDLGIENARLKNSKLKNYRLWNKPISQVKSLDLLIYVKTMEIEGEQEAASQDVEELQRITIMAMLEGRLNDAPYLSYAGQRVKMTMGDFTTLLQYAELSQTRKKAILFSLETGMKPEDVVILTWKMAQKMKMTPLAKSIVESTPRNIHVNYVFWEEMETFSMTAPLFGLSQDVQDLFSGLTHREASKLFHEAVLFDSNEELEFLRAQNYF
jgi:hypothetical protein